MGPRPHATAGSAQLVPGVAERPAGVADRVPALAAGRGEHAHRVRGRWRPRPCRRSAGRRSWAGNRQLDRSALLQRADEPGRCSPTGSPGTAGRSPSRSSAASADAARALYGEYALLKYDTAAHGLPVRRRHRRSPTRRPRQRRAAGQGVAAATCIGTPSTAGTAGTNPVPESLAMIAPTAAARRGRRRPVRAARSAAAGGRRDDVGGRAVARGLQGLRRGTCGRR